MLDTDYLLVLSLLFYVPLGILMYLIIWRFRSIIKARNDNGRYEHINLQTRKDLALELRLKSIRLKFSAYSILIGIIMILVIGVSIFYSAGAIANIEFRNFNSLSNDRTFEKLIKQKFLQEHNMTEKEFDEDYGLQELYYEKVHTELLKRKKEIAELENDNDNSDEKLYSLISSSVIRIGISLIIFFIAQIFLRLYRYSLQLSDFFESKSDALVLGKEEDRTIEEFSEFLKTDKITLGPLPKTPTNELIELLKIVNNKN